VVYRRVNIQTPGDPGENVGIDFVVGLELLVPLLVHSQPHLVLLLGATELLHLGRGCVR
jgi:hypothetical protein